MMAKETISENFNLDFLRVGGIILGQISLEVIYYPLTTAAECIPQLRINIRRPPASQQLCAAAGCQHIRKKIVKWLP
jgi:hypothetical protein